MARILALTSRLPYPPREGHQLRSWHLLRALAAEHEVTLLSCQREDDEPDRCAPLRDLLAGLELFPIRAQQSSAALAYALAKGTLGPAPFVVEKYSGADLRARVAQLAPQADLLHVDMLPLMALADAAGARVPRVLNAHNVEHRLLRQRVVAETNWPRRLFLQAQTRKLEGFERDACRRASLVLACSHDDARELAQLAPRTPVAVVPNGVDVARIRPERTNAVPGRLVFIGQMGWFPNREGVEWFLAEILPRVLAARPEAEFVLVGKNEGLQVPGNVRSRVRLLGFVDDVAAELERAAIAVVPLRSGSGTRLKVLEAMAHALPIVTTTIGAEGIELVPGHEALFADDAPAFAEAIMGLVDAPAEGARLGMAARARAETDYDWNAIGARLLDAYSGLLDQPLPRMARQR